MIEMRSLSDFHNVAITKSDGTHTVKDGDTFTTNWLHAKDLVINKLAEPVDPKALDEEPVEALTPHHSISVPDLAKINGRRADLGGDQAVTAKVGSRAR